MIKEQLIENHSSHTSGEFELHKHHKIAGHSRITPFVLLLALSIHGLFEGLALGLQGSFNEALFLLICIMTHKWAEGFTLVSY